MLHTVDKGIGSSQKSQWQVFVINVISKNWISLQEHSGWVNVTKYAMPFSVMKIWLCHGNSTSPFSQPPQLPQKNNAQETENKWVIWDLFYLHACLVSGPAVYLWSE